MITNAVVHYTPSPGLTRALAIVVGIAAMFCSNNNHALLPEAEANIPHVSNKAKEDFLQYKHAAKHRAFAIAPGGAWAWQSGASSEEEAEQLALNDCQSHTRQKCVLYALDDRIVFNNAQWPTLWGPYPDSNVADKVATGNAVGQRFYDLAWKNTDGQKVSLSSLQGELVILHFWGSWCPPCLREFPSLAKLHAEIKTKFPADITMVMLQLRESFDESTKWVQQYEFSGLPLYDSGVENNEQTMLTLSDGSRIKDRNLARVFPSTYVLDRNGVVLFSHHGPVSDWLEYVPFLEHAVRVTENKKAVKSRAAAAK